MGSWRSEDIFDHPTAFSNEEITAVANPLEDYLHRQQVWRGRFGVYGLLLLPEIRGEWLRPSWKSRIFGELSWGNEIAGYGYWQCDLHAEWLESWLLEHPFTRRSKRSLPALKAAVLCACAFCWRTPTLGAMDIRVRSIRSLHPTSLGLEVNVSYHSNMDEYAVQCSERKNANIWSKYMVQAGVSTIRWHQVAWS